MRPRPFTREFSSWMRTLKVRVGGVPSRPGSASGSRRGAVVKHPAEVIGWSAAWPGATRSKDRTIRARWPQPGQAPRGFWKSPIEVQQGQDDSNHADENYSDPSCHHVDRGGVTRDAFPGPAKGIPLTISACARRSSSIQDNASADSGCKQAADKGWPKDSHMNFVSPTTEHPGQKRAMRLTVRPVFIH